VVIDRPVVESSTPATTRSGRRAPSPLQSIKGIGPKYAEVLAGLGYSSAADIAAWSGEDIERAAAALGISAERIRKAKWVERARELANAG
jgi:predicted flap endonuclease-1-like 5' DNA nuclease